MMSKSFRPKSARKASFASRAEQRRYQLWLAKHACQPEPPEEDPWPCVVRHAANPDEVIVLYYSMGEKTLISHCLWMVPQLPAQSPVV